MPDDIKPENEFNIMRMILGEDKERIRRGDRMVAVVYDSVFEANRWMCELPYLQFPAHWQVKIYPAFVGAVIRFRVKDAKTPDGESISVYFDGYNNLGIEEKPYWEVYPVNGETSRFLLGDEDSMIAEIEKGLRGLEE